MLKFHFVALLSIIFFAFTSDFAQTAENKTEENQKQQIALLEQIAKDADGLRLPENRALVLAKLGDSFWATDEKRARQFFQDSMIALVAAQTEAEGERKQPANNLAGLIYGASPRQEILMQIAGHDAEFALEAFYKSRPSKIVQALAIGGAGKSDAESKQYALNETNFEQSLISRLSDQNPQRSLKLFRESLAKGVTYEAMNLLEKLKTKDLELANQLAAEVASKLLATDFEKDENAPNLVAAFVGEYGKKPEPDQKTIKVDEKVLRDLTAKYIKNLLKSEDSGYEAEYILPMAEKYAPESLAALRQKKAKYDKDNKREEYDAYSKLLEGNPSPEKLLSEADKFPDDLKTQIYYAAAEKNAQNGNVDAAKKIIAARLPENDRENYLTQIDYTVIQQALTAEKYDEAAGLIGQIPNESQRFYFFIQLATTIYQKNPAENKRRALSVVEQARAMIPQPPETLEDISLLMQTATTIAEMDAEQAFPILENLTYQLNEYIEASAVIGKYRADGTMRKGEMLVNSYGSINGLNTMTEILGILRKKDFARTTAYVSSFQRPEVRVILEMQLIEPPADPSDTPAVGSGGATVTTQKSN